MTRTRTCVDPTRPWPEFSEYWNEARERAERTHRWYLDHADLLRRALL